MKLEPEEIWVWDTVAAVSAHTRDDAKVEVEVAAGYFVRDKTLGLKGGRRKVHSRGRIDPSAWGSRTDNTSSSSSSIEFKGLIDIGKLTFVDICGYGMVELHQL